MDLWTLPLHADQFQDMLTILAAALGCGLLIGIERERHKQREIIQSFAGVRSFALGGLLGALCFLFGMAVGITGAIFISGMSLLAQLKSPPEDSGVTSEIAFVITYFIGALCIWSIPLAASLAVAMTIILMAKQSMHGIARQWITESELHDGLILLALALIALPLMPNRPLWGPVLNPYVIVRLLTLILFVQASAHLARRLLSSQRALTLSSLASGFVSSTATIATLGMEVRAGRAPATSNAGAALMSCVGTLIQLLIIAAGVSLAWFKLLLLPTLSAVVIAVGWALWLLRNAPAHKSPLVNDSQMFSLKEAAIVAAALTIIQAAVYGLGLWLGNAGVLVGTLLASLFEVHAAMAAIFLQAEPTTASGHALLWAIILGLTVHALAKSINSWLTGGFRYALAFIPGLLFHIIVQISLFLVVAHLI